MKHDHTLEIPVGVSLTHDRGRPVLFAYVGGNGRLGMRAKRFNPQGPGGLERALKQAIRWRKQALREHTAAVAALPARPKRKATATRRNHGRRRSDGKNANHPTLPERFSVEVRFVSGVTRKR